MTDSDSDLEFEKFLQESLSSTASSVDSLTNRQPKPTDSRQQVKKEFGGTDERLSSLGMSWLKSPPVGAGRTDVDMAADTDEWINDIPADDSKTVTSKRRTSTASSLGDDLLTGSGYSIISEIEHQLGLRGNRSTPSGQDTLNEEDEKKHFFEQLEKGRGSSLDYSELNRQLDATGSQSLKATDRLTTSVKKTLNTIDEDTTPLVSDSEDDESTQSHTPLQPSKNPELTSPKNVLISSRSSVSSKTSPQHSFSDAIPVPSMQKLVPMSDTPVHPQSTISPDCQQQYDSVGGFSNTTVKPVTDSGTGDWDQSVSSTDSSATSAAQSVTSPLAPLSVHSSQSNHISSPAYVTRHTRSNQLHPLSIGTLEENTKPQQSSNQRLLLSPKSQQKLGPATIRKSFQTEGVLTTATEAQPPQLYSMSSPIAIPTGFVDNSATIPVIASVPSSKLPLTSGLTTSATTPALSLANLPTAQTKDSNQNKNMEQLLRTLAVEELATLSHDMMSKTENDQRLHESSPAKSTNSPSPVQIHQQIEQWKSSWEREKERVKELEDQVKECVRKEERLQLEYGRQIQDLRGELLEQRAKVRSLKLEKDRSTSVNTDEQERLIQGYQKENERLYTELSLTSKDLKSTKAKLMEDNNKLATELANMRTKHETQNETIRQLRQQVDSRSYGLPHDTERIESKERLEDLKEKLKESYENIKKLQMQVEHLANANEGLEKHIVALQNDRGSPVTGQAAIALDKVEDMKQKYEQEIALLHSKLKELSNAHDIEIRKNELLLQEKDDELKVLKKKATIKKDDSLQKRDGPYLIKSRTAADSRRIKELEHQVSELQATLKRRHPNSIPALIYATNDGGREKEEIASYLEQKVKRLETKLLGKEDEVVSKMNDMRKQFQEMEVLYEQQIESLKKQVTALQRKSQSRETSTKPHIHSNLTEDTLHVQAENTKLKEQVSQLSVEISHQRLQLEGLTAQIEGEKRKSCEQWEQRVKDIEKEHAEKMDSIVANLIQERSESNITRLKTRLAAREARIKQLEEELEITRVDEETLVLSRALEEDLRNQVDVLTHELEESKKHHTPEMHHFNSLLAKISHLETKLGEYQRKLQETKEKPGFVSQEQVKHLELKYRRQLSEKNKQIEKFREELDTLMDTLHSIQESNEAIIQ